jgi:hypothetical protein
MNPERPVGGIVASMGLTDWWLSTFTSEERDWIEIAIATASRLTVGSVGRVNPYPLTGGRILAIDFPVSMNTYTSIMVLHDIGCAIYPRSRTKGLETLRKAETEGLALMHQHPRYLQNVHFVYTSMIQLNYRERTKIPSALAAAIEACQGQIAIAPLAAKMFTEQWGMVPRHIGYHQLSVICDKQGNWGEAIQLCRQALEQGWAGDWEKRITRYEQKLARATSTAKPYAP